MKFSFIMAASAAFLLSAGAGAQTYRYIDASSLTIAGKPLPTSSPYTRIDTSAFHFGSRSIDAKCCQSTGLMVCFRTDSRNITARWKTSGKNSGSNMCAVGQKGLDLYIRDGGSWRFAGAGVPSMGTAPYSSHSCDLVRYMAEGEKECILYLPLFDELYDLELGVDEGSHVTPMENPFRHRIVFQGSSITHGASATRPGMCYVALFGRRTGLYSINMGFSGDSKLQKEYAEYLAGVDADAFVFDAFSNPSAQEIHDRFDVFVDILRKAHPDTPLIFLQTERREKRNFDVKFNASELAKQDAAREEVTDRMKTDRNIWLIDSSGFLGDDGLGTADGTHPTDLGFMRWVDKMTPQLMKILKKYGIR